jgi:hypothetical protein
MQDEIMFNNHTQMDATVVVVVALFSLFTMWLVVTADQLQVDWQGMMSTGGV